MEDYYWYLNGEIVKSSEAKVPVTDLGMLRGCGVFDYARTYGMTPFHLDDHIDRFLNSAELLNLPLKKTKDEVRQIVLDLIGKNGIEDVAIRMMATGGQSSDLFMPEDKPTFAVMIFPRPELDKKLFETGVKIVTTKHKRSYPNIKSCYYQPGIFAHAEAEKADAFDALYTDENNNLLELTTSNFFIVKDRKLITPKEGILTGVTRKITIQLAKPDYKIEERVVGYAELAEASESFMTATNKDILPVVQVDDIVIGSGQVGEVTKEMMSRFSEYTRQYK